ncbi:unnamed protein product, partial [Arabidopsis halleri]
VFWRSNLLGEVKKYLASRNFSKKTFNKVQESLTVAQTEKITTMKFWLSSDKQKLILYLAT